MIKVTGLCRDYGKLRAVDNLTFKVEPGQVLGLVGPNGAGKTTTLRMLAGIIRPSSGTINLAGHDLSQAPLKAKSNTGYVPDDPRLFDSLTVDEHLSLTASLYRLSDVEHEAQTLIDQFDLTDKRNAPADSLSLGMRQKLAICCAYLIAPPVLIFDEPLTGLDPRGILTIQRSIKERAAAGASIIISSHLLSMVESLCTHILILQQGRNLLHDSLDNVVNAVEEGSEKPSLEALFLAITRPDSENTDA